MSLIPNNKDIMPITICDRCKDLGYLIGSAHCPNNPSLNREWTEVCPYCMPTKKHGNLQKILSREVKLIEHKPDSPEQK